MRIVIASDKFRGTLTAAEATTAMAAGVRDALPTAAIDLVPVADGGEGTVAAVMTATGGRWVPRRVTGPLPERKVDAGYLSLDGGRTALIEVAAASGISLVEPGYRQPMATTTFGAGELIAAAVAAGATRILLALGGTATIDGGIGAAQACRFTVLTIDGEPTSPTEPLCGRDLANVLTVKHGRGEVTAGVEFVGLCDVTNPLHGPAGAARTYGPQKGATPAEVEQLDGDLRRLAERMEATAQAALPGAGAAGGMGFAVAAYFRGTLRGGFDWVAETVGLTAKLAGADLCLTGEGRLDTTTSAGKAVAGVGWLCRSAGVPCYAVVGQLQPGIAMPVGVRSVQSAMPGVGATAAEEVRVATQVAVRDWLDGVMVLP